MVSKQRLSVPLWQQVEATESRYLDAWKCGDIVFRDQATIDWVIVMFMDIKKFVIGLDRAIELSIGALHGTSSWRVDTMFADYREAVDELPETTG